jgi:hypothetical protein
MEVHSLNTERMLAMSMKKWEQGRGKKEWSKFHKGERRGGEEANVFRRRRKRGAVHLEKEGERGASFPFECALHRNNTGNSKQIFPEKELRGHSPNFHIHVSVSDLYIPKINLPILPQENRWTEPGNIYKSFTDT